VRKVTERIILVLNLISASGLLFSYLAPLVNPSRFVAPALFGLAYPYILVLNFLFLVYWIIKLKWQVVISLLVILLGWNHLNNLFPLHLGLYNMAEEDLQGKRFSVLAYNVRGFDRYHWTTDLDARNGILDFVVKQDPDIICFQEYFTSTRKGETQADLSRKLAQFKYSAVYITTDPANRSGSGIATYSKFPILKHSRIPFNSTFNGAMYTDLLIGQDTLRVFNIHLQSIRFHKENYDFMDTMRLAYSNEQMRELRSIGSRLKTAFSLRAEQAGVIASYIKESPFPVIVMGDFNDTPHSYAYRRVGRGLNDAFRQAGKGFGNTYAGDLPSFRIDHILYSDPLVPVEFKRFKTGYSDHFPVSTSFLLP
jgi:endonuclease/exonuclease/phosphatase family metal-dependent hydrolase